jgi:hypothetical protein
MARKHFAKALVGKANVHPNQWIEEIKKNHDNVSPKGHSSRVASKIVARCDSKRYLLSHATIVASVDTYAPKNSKTGKYLRGGTEIDVRFPNYRIKPECHSIINANGDAWDRALLLNTYRTFVGANNFLEHIQIPALSKGFIVDALARDTGNSVYIDILVATDRKHSLLISDIQSGEITSLSMGCVSQFTICSKCGNVASDDTQVCICIQYEGKGKKFTDEDGIIHPISEIIGHVAVPNSNQFIEASWVKVPAFKGAVRRNLLNPDAGTISSVSAVEIQAKKNVFVQIPDGIKRAASKRMVAEDKTPTTEELDESFDSPPEEGTGDDSPSDGESSPNDDFSFEDPPSSDEDSGGTSEDSLPESDSDDPLESKFDDVLGKIEERILTSISDRLIERLSPKPEDVDTVIAPPLSVETSNDNLVRASKKFHASVSKLYPKSPSMVSWATSVHKIIYGKGIRKASSFGITPRDIITLSWIEDRIAGKNYPDSLYQCAIKSGPSSKYPSEMSFLSTCRINAGRKFDGDEEKFLLRKGRMSSFGKLLRL